MHLGKVLSVFHAELFLAALDSLHCGLGFAFELVLDEGHLALRNHVRTGGHNSCLLRQLVHCITESRKFGCPLQKVT